MPFPCHSPLLLLVVEKVLKELIEPYTLRVQRLREFLSDVKPSLQYEIVPLSDPFGPSVVDTQLQCIIVSEETRKGGEAVNRKRLENVRWPMCLFQCNKLVIKVRGWCSLLVSLRL